MPRNTTAAFDAEAAKSVKTVVVFAELVFVNGPLRFWSGVGPIDWDGKTWLGTGRLGGISPMEETANGKVPGITLSLSGMPPEVLAAVANEARPRNPVKVWIGFLDANGQVVADPHRRYDGWMDVPSTEEGGESGTVSITVEHELQALDRAAGRRVTDEDQRADFPGDRSHEFVAGLQDKEITWGRL